MRWERGGHGALLIRYLVVRLFFFFFQAEDGIRDVAVTGVQTCALPVASPRARTRTGCRRIGGWARGRPPSARRSIGPGARVPRRRASGSRRPAATRAPARRTRVLRSRWSRAEASAPRPRRVTDRRRWGR